MRPGAGYAPLLAQLRIVDDLKAGHTATALAEEYRTTAGSITNYKHGRFAGLGDLPLGFSRLWTPSNSEAYSK
jgi:hypothetical protein